ncbi:hypothetical protein JXA88_18410 [Candidatus Fermentibacteria bacterium]|nr:hypothetical protein [Candidatus Fermentibacteria bacterium]
MSQQVAVGPKMARRALVMFIGKTAAIVLSLVAAALIPRQLGPRGMGFYSYFYSSVFTIVCILDVGGSMLLRRYVPEFLTHRRAEVRPLFLASLRAKLLVLMVFAVVTPLVSDPGMFGLVLIAAACSSMVESVQTLLYAGGALGSYAAVSAVVTALRILLVLLLAPRFQRIGISLALVMSAAITIAVFIMPAVRVLPPSRERLSQSYWRFLRFGLVSYGADLAFVLSNRVALILGRHMMDDMAELGYLGVAFMVYLLARQLAFFIGETSIPSLVHYHASGERTQFARTMHHVWRYTTIVVFAAAALIICYAEALVLAIVGPVFAKTAVLIRLLVPAFAAMTLTLCVRIALFAQEKSFRLLVAHGGALIAFVVMVGGWWLVRPPMTSEAIALAFSLSSVVGFALMAFHSGTGVSGTTLLVSVVKPIIAAILVCQSIRVIGPQGPWLVASVPLALVGYLLVLLVIRGLERRDWHRVMGLMGRSTGKDENWAS